MKQTHKARIAYIVSRITTWTLRILLAFTVLFFLAVILTASLSGNGETQKAALEQIFSSVFNHQARIQVLKGYEMFPTLKADFENLVILDSQDDEPLIILEKGFYAQDSIQRFLGGEPVIAASFSNLLTAPGFFGPYSIHFVSGGIDPVTELKDGPHKASAEGNYGGYNLKASFPMMGRVHGNALQYSFIGSAPIHVDLDNIQAQVILTIKGNTMIFDPLTLQVGAAKLDGTIVVPGLPTESDPVTRNTVLKLTDPTSGLTVEGEILSFGRQVEFAGKLSGENLSIKGLKDKAGTMQAILVKLVEMIEHSRQKDVKGKMIPDGSAKIILALDIKSLVACRALTNFTGTFAYQDKKADLKDLKWKIDGTDYTASSTDQNMTMKVSHDGKADPALAKCFH